MRIVSIIDGLISAAEGYEKNAGEHAVNALLLHGNPEAVGLERRAIHCAGRAEGLKEACERFQALLTDPAAA